MLLNWFYFSKFIFGVMRCGHRHWDHHLIFIQVLLIRFLSSLFEQKPYTMAWIFIKKLPHLMIHSKEINAKKDNFKGHQKFGSCRVLRFECLLATPLPEAKLLKKIWGVCHKASATYIWTQAVAVFVWFQREQGNVESLNLGHKIFGKFTKLSKLGFSMECFTTHFSQFSVAG